MILKFFNKGYLHIFENLGSKIWFDSLPEVSIICYSLQILVAKRKCFFVFYRQRGLHLTRFCFIWVWMLHTFEETYLKFSNFPCRKFWWDRSCRRSTLNDTLSKWLRSLYWMILGLYFAWKTFRRVNVNLWKSGKSIS